MSIPPLSRLNRPALLLGALIIFAASAFSQPTGTFTISAGSASITPTGSGSIPFTLTSVNGFSGQIVVGCQPPAVPPNVKIPSCGGGPIALYTLTDSQVLNGSLGLNAYGAPVPVGVLAAHNPLLAILFVIALLSGLTLRRRSAHLLKLPLLLVAFALLSCVVGCGSNPQGYTPGTYNYTVTASQYGTVTPLQEGTSAVVTVR